MTEIVLHDVDPVLLDRIRRVAQARGWTLPRTLLHLLEQGLHVYEGDGKASFDSAENDVLQAALAALQDIPDDSGFAMIGRVEDADERGNFALPGSDPQPPSPRADAAAAMPATAQGLFP